MRENFHSNYIQWPEVSHTFASIWYRGIALVARKALALVTSFRVAAEAITWVRLWIVAFVDI